MDYDKHPDGIIIAGGDSIVTYVNNRVVEMARSPREAIIGEHLADAVPFDDLAGNSWYDVVRPYDGFNLRTRTSESSWYSPKGSEYLITASLIRDEPAGRVVEVVMSVRNARIRNQRDRERSDLVATVAHELRSPLTGIKGFASTLLNKAHAFDEQQQRLMLQTIDADADRLTRLISELLDAARIDAGRLALRLGPVRLDELVNQLLLPVSTTSDAQYDLQVGENLATIWGDTDRLSQVFTNLVENANRHGQGLHRVYISNRPGASGAPGIAVEIHDAGPGIPDEARQRVFSRFWRSGPAAGSGLGMYIVRGIVHGHSGTIDIGESESGGAVISVWLPTNEPAAVGQVLAEPLGNGPARLSERTTNVCEPASCANSYPARKASMTVPEAPTAEVVDRFVTDALSAVTAATTPAELKQVRLAHAGDKSPLALVNRAIGQLEPSDRKEVGRLVGQARGRVNAAITARDDELQLAEETERLQRERVDVTLPTDTEPVGARHPVTMISERVADIFVSMGWQVAEGPEVEAEWLTFDALNLGPDHPARTMQDTFWVKPESSAQVLRTHTSPVQARTMLVGEPPFYVICPGRVFRTDELDATHSPVFHQVEGLAIDRGLSMAHLKGTLDHFARAIYGDGMTTRFRPSYFPFTEPSAEMDLLCYVCHNDPAAVAGCRTCRGEGWVEWGGCGVVNPRVLIACGVNPQQYSGFAFGIGLDRTITGRYDIADLRDLFDGDIRFTEPFGVEL